MSKGLWRYRTVRGAVVVLALLLAPAAVQAIEREVLAISHTQTAEVAAGEVLVRFRHQLPSLEIEERVESFGARALSWHRELGFVRLKIPDTESLADFIASHEGDAEILSIEPNPLLTVMADKPVAPNDPLFPKQWGLRKIGVAKAWATTLGREDMVIAVLDTGVDETHADLRGQFLQGYNVLAPAESPADDHGHGTAIAGILAAGANNDVGIVGTCRNCRLLPVKVLDAYGEGTYADLINGILWAVDHGARVLNLSLGGTVESQALQDAVDYARSRGVVLVAAGGNGGEEQPIYPAAYGSVIGVGATDSRDHAWRWSGRGPHIRLTAPGVGIWTLAPADQFARVTGTSAATAHVAGVVALLLSRDGTLSPAEIEQSLYSSVDDLGPVGRDAVYGFGRLNAHKAFLAKPDRGHDVNLSGLRIEPSTFRIGDAIQVRATVSNEGAFVEEALEVSLSVNRVTLAELRIEALKPGEQQDVLLDWSSALPDTGEIVVSARVEAVPGEIDSTDNERLQRYGFSSEDGEIVSLYAVEPPTHQWIALQAYNKLPSGQLKTELGQYLPTSSTSSYYSSSFNPSSYGWPNNTNSYASSSAALIEGIWEEDNPETRVLNHFWQPGVGYNAGLLGAYDSAVKTALEDRFFTALLVYSTDKAASYYWLGRTVHLLEDMSVPAHTLNDPHLPGDSDNYEGFTSSSENYKLITSSSANTTIPNVQSLPNYPYQTPTDDLTKIFYSLADKANDFDSDDANGQSSQYGQGKFRSARNALASGKTVSKAEYWGAISKIRDLVKNVDYDVVQNSCESRIYYYRSFYDLINNTINRVKVIYTDGTSVFFTNLDETTTGVFEEVLSCIHQRELEARAIGHVAALYQLFWDRTHAVRWSSPPPSTMVSGQKYSVSWIVASGTSISHTNVHWDTDPVRLKTTSAFDSTVNECSSPCSPRTFTNSISTNPIGAPAPGTYYFVAHAKIDGLDAWSDVVSVTVLPSSPTIGRSPTAMTFSGVQGGSNPASQTLSITNTGGGTLSWSLSDNASWLSLSPSSGSTTTETDSVTVSVNTSGLGAGNHSATITISASGATNSPQTVGVSLTVTSGAPGIGRSPATMSFSGAQGGSNPASQTLSITNTGGGTLSWSLSDNASWLSLSPSSGSTTTEADSVAVSVNTSGLGAGNYSATITVSAPGSTNSPQTVAVSLTVGGTSPAIGRSPAAMSFSGVEGGANPGSQTLSITNTGGGTLSWSVSDNASWLNLSPSSGTTTTETDSVAVSVNSSGLAAGNYSATITISAPGATNTPQTLSVSFALSGGGSPAQGFFLENRLQACSGGAPAVLLWWTAPAGAGSVFTVRRIDGAYTATVNSSQGGMAHLVSSLLVPGQTYSFLVEGTLNGSTIQTNSVEVPVLSDECRLAVGAGELPHLPVAWTGVPSCSGGTVSLPVYWTAVGGSTSYTLTRIDYVDVDLKPYPNLTSTSFVDSGLVPGAVYEYLLEAVGSGGTRPTSRFSAFIPSGICSEPATPGPFTATVSEPVCVAGKGAVTLSWTPASGAASGMGTEWSDDGFRFGRGTTFSGSSKLVDESRPGALLKLMVQAESATTPNQYRNQILAQRIPLDICGGAGAQAPSVTTVAATYIQDRQALLRASVSPNGAPTNTYIEWGTTASYGSMTPPRDAGDGYRRVSLGETLTGLACNTTYYFHGVAASPLGQAVGTSSSFTTLPCPVVCYPLSRSMNDPGGGGFPVAAPAQSPGCPSGQYTAGQTIQVTASPAAGWQIGSWAGTQNNSSTSTSNTVIMPAGNHFVHVNYVRPIDSTTPLSFYTLAPCRLIDTRQTVSPLRSGAGPLRTVPVTGVCGVPANARAVSINITAVNPTGAGFLTLFPADQLQPGTSNLNFGAAQTRANNAVLALSASGLLGAVAGIAADNQVDLIIDVNGYFVPDF